MKETFQRWRMRPFWCRLGMHAYRILQKDQDFAYQECMRESCRKRATTASAWLHAEIWFLARHDGPHSNALQAAWPKRIAWLNQDEEIQDGG